MAHEQLCKASSFFQLISLALVGVCWTSSCDMGIAVIALNSVLVVNNDVIALAEILRFYSYDKVL